MGGVHSVGNDIIEIERVKEFLQRGWRYRDRLFTRNEVRLAEGRGDSDSFYAGRFAAKEAVAKCLGPPLPWHDIEILSSNQGKPVVSLHGRALEAAGGGVVEVSISHCRGYATAVAVLEKR